MTAMDRLHALVELYPPVGMPDDIAPKTLVQFWASMVGNHEPIPPAVANADRYAVNGTPIPTTATTVDFVQSCVAVDTTPPEAKARTYAVGSKLYTLTYCDGGEWFTWVSRQVIRSIDPPFGPQRPHYTLIGAVRVPEVQP